MHAKPLIALVFAILAGAAAPLQAQRDWWWDGAWWSEGRLDVPENHATETTWTSYPSGEVEVPAMVVRPAQPGRFPAVLFQHGRRGLDEQVQRLAQRIAARGFVVLAPDIYTAHFIGTHPIRHDYALEKDVDAAVDVLLARDDISGSKACIYSHTRGGYYALKVATTFRRQERDLACYVSTYPHLQDPNAPEPLQVYGYAPEIEDLVLPTLIFAGDEEQYQRLRVIETSVRILQDKGRDVTLVIYPGVGRGFDFRDVNVRTFADDLASKDAAQRAARFMRRHLAEAVSPRTDGAPVAGP